MADHVIIGECKEPWIYWWAQLTAGERISLKRKYFADSWPDMHGSLFAAEKKIVWESENVHPLQDYDWVGLADLTFQDSNLFTKQETREIWRQVYRIASEKLVLP